MILVTGATGFLGSALVEQLIARGEKVRAIRRVSSVIPANLLAQQQHIEWVNADMLDLFALETALEGINKVYHCAAMISFDPADKKQMIKINAEGTANLVNLCLEHGIEKLVHVSSVAALGEAKPGKLIDESCQWEYNSNQDGYSIAKYESEMHVWRGIAEGLNAVIVNPSIIIGAAAGKTGSGSLFETIRKGIGFYPQGGFGFVDVSDVAKCMIQLMESDINAQRFLINGENQLYKQLFEDTATQFGIKAPTFRVKPWMLEMAWRAEKLSTLVTRKAPGLTKTTARSASKVQFFANDKIKKAIPTDFKPFEQSLKEICAALSKKDD